MLGWVVYCFTCEMEDLKPVGYSASLGNVRAISRMEHTAAVTMK